MEQSLWMALIDVILVLVLFVRLFPSASKKRESVIVAAIVVLLTLFPSLWHLEYVEIRGPLKETIMDQADPMVKFDNYVEELQKEGLHTGDIIRFAIPFYEGVNQKELQFVKSFSEELENWFLSYDVLSLANTKKYRLVDYELFTDPYLDESIQSDDFDLDEWKRELDKDERVKRFLIGADYKCAYVLLLLPRDYDEIEVFFEIQKFLEKKKRSILKDWNKWDDIHLHEDYMVKLSNGEMKEHVLPSGWAIARALMTIATVIDVLQVSSIGIGLVLVVFALCLISGRQAIIATSIVTLSFIWTTGTIGILLRNYSSSELLQLLDLRLYLRIYIVFVFTANIVSGISFGERKFSYYNYLRKRYPRLSRAMLWSKTDAVNERIMVTAVISIINYISLRQIGVRPIWEVGFLSACGVFYLWMLTLYFIPAMHILVGGEKTEEKQGVFTRAGSFFNSVLQGVVNLCYRALDRNVGDYDPNRPFRLYMGITALCSTIALAIVLIDLSGINPDHRFIEIRTRPLEYLETTIVHRSYDYLRSIEEGFENVTVLLKAKDSSRAYEDIDFLATVEKVAEEIKSHSEAQAVYSVMDALSVISREEYEELLPPDDEEAGYSFQELSSNLREVKDQFWYDEGVVLFTSVIMDDSKALEGLIAHILSLREMEKFSEVEIIPFGNGALWPLNDRKVSVGEPRNAASNFLLLFASVYIWIKWRKRGIKNSIRDLIPTRCGLVICLPFAFSGSIMVIAMAAFEVPLDQATACIAAFAVAAAVDFAIYPMADYQDKITNGATRREALRYALLERGEVVVADVVLNCVCFATLFLSDFLPVQRMGWIMIAMLIACGIGSLLIMMSALPYCVRERQKGENDEKNIYGSNAGSMFRAWFFGSGRYSLG